MLHLTDIEAGLPVFKALSSEIRIRIIELLLQNGAMNMNELSEAVGVTNGAMTGHIKKLEECSLVKVSHEAGERGSRKICQVNVDKILVEIQDAAAKEDRNIYRTEISVGHYSNYEIYPTCGISTPTAIIGEVDDARYFAHSDRYQAKILWFGHGYVEYMIPNFLPVSTKIDKMTLSFEISSEAPGVNNEWPSDISFSLNDTVIGKWTSPGDFGDVRGIFTPSWWFPNWNQYGLLKMLTVSREGTFLDGLKISDHSIDEFALDYRSTIRFRLSVPETAKNMGGLTLFGAGFGNYNQDIKVQIAYSPLAEKG